MNDTYSVIIPAYNEQVWLPKTIISVRKAMETVKMDGELVVVDNNSNDNTAAIAHYYGAEVVFEPINQISRARNTGTRYSRGRFLIFLDADTRLSKELLQMAINRLSTGKCCGGGAFVGLDEPIPKIIRWGLHIWNRFSLAYGIAAGCFIFCTREGFEGIGGFSEKVYASEEFWFSKKMKAWGTKRSMGYEIIEKPSIVTSARKLQWFSPIELILILLIGTFPFAVRYRALCSFWYRRPPR
jgi:glycosyltransferase involved in cell wall biosynthesis